MLDPVQEIKTKLNIEDIVAQYVPLKKAGRYLKANCPFHQEKTPSFMVSPEKQIAYCFSCQKGGDLFAFIQEVEGLDFREALEYLADKAHVDLPKNVHVPQVSRDAKDLLKAIHIDASKFFVQKLWETEEGEKVRAYLKNRGIEEETMKFFQLGFAPKDGDALCRHLLSKKYEPKDLLESTLVLSRDSALTKFSDRFQLRLMFPIDDQSGEPVAFGGRALKKGDDPKYLNSPEYALYHKGKTLYNLGRAKQAIRSEDLAVLVEGYLDVMASHQAGVSYVAATSGTALTEDQFRLLKRSTKNIALAFDSDSAGQEALLRAVKIAQNLDLELFVISIEGVKDAADLVKQDPQAWVAAVQNRKPYLDYFFDLWKNSLNSSDVQEKKAFSDRFMELLMGLKHPVLQDHYLKKLAEAIGTPAEMLLRHLRELEAKTRSRTHSGVGKSAQKGAVTLSSSERLWNVFYSLLFANPNLFFSVIKQASREGFVQELQELELNKQLTKLEEASFLRFLAKLEEESLVYSEALRQYNLVGQVEIPQEFQKQAFEAEVLFQEEKLLLMEIKKILALLYLELTP